MRNRDLRDTMGSKIPYVLRSTMRWFTEFLMTLNWKMVIWYRWICGVVLNGYFGDSAYSFALGDVGDDTLQLMRVTKMALYKAIEAAKGWKQNR